MMPQFDVEQEFEEWWNGEGAVNWRSLLRNAYDDQAPTGVHSFVRIIESACRMAYSRGARDALMSQSSQTAVPSA